MTPILLALLPHWHLSPWVIVLILVAHLAAGIVLGGLYFSSVWWTARRLGSDGRMPTTIAFTIGRFVLLGGMLALASLEGALPLLLMALGVLLARPAIMRRVRDVA